MGLLVHVDGTTRVIGGFGAGRPVPRQLFSTGHIRGVLQRHATGVRGGQPHAVQLVPPIAEDNRDPVPVADQADTVDSLSAMAQLMHDIAATGHCDGTLKTFDGRRLADLTAHTVGMETLAPTGRSSFSGPALRCDFIGHQLGGWVHDVDRAELQRPQYGSALVRQRAAGRAADPGAVRVQDALLRTHHRLHRGAAVNLGHRK